MAVMTEAIAGKREELEAELLRLEREQGVALLDGKPVDMAPVIATREALSALDLAEAEAAHRERDASAKQYSADRRKARQDLDVAITGYRYRMKATQDAAEALIVELQILEEHRATIAANARRLGHSIPLNVTAHEHHNIVSRLLADKLNGLGTGHGFGVLEWKSVVPVEDWTAHTERHVIRFLDEIAGVE